MKIIWGEPKRIANIEKHGLDLAALSYEFFLGALVSPAKAGRFQAVGRLGDGTISVIFTTLGTEGLSVISMHLTRKRRKEPDLMAIKHTKQDEFKPGRDYSKTDWDEVSDNPELTKEQLAEARPFAEVFPDLAAGMDREIAKRGRPTLEQTKKPVTIRLDPDVVDAFKSAGKGWRSRMNDALRKTVSL
ncbi:BrnA antitoxin family protein [Rhizobium sp. PL01]|uniref:BrnA antitoxin family protein n=1 Tax=Rhizobium sp. PL01 TaxID=3085631 RepID=UPI003993BCB8